MTEYESSSSSVAGITQAVAHAQSELPHGELSAGVEHLAQAGAVLGGLAAESPQLGEVVENLAVAQGALGRAVMAITHADESLTQYRAEISGTAASRLTSVETVEDSPNTLETAFKDPMLLIVEERQVGDTKFKTAFCGHSAGNAAKIAAALQDCDIIAIESPGWADKHERAAQEEAGTLLLSSAVDPEKARNLLAESPEIDGAAIYAEFIGSDKRVVLLDMNQDHPDYPVVQQEINSRSVFAEAVEDVIPLHETKRHMLRAAKDFAAAVTVRNPVINEQLKALSLQVGHARVGVITGALHHEVTSDLGETNNEKSAEISDALRNTPNFSSLIEIIMNGEQPSDSAIDRALLTTHMCIVEPQAESVVSRMDDKQVARVVSHIDTIAAKPLDKRAKRHEVELFLQSVADIVKD